jgi:hypothetical protein
MYVVLIMYIFILDLIKIRLEDAELYVKYIVINKHTNEEFYMKVISCKDCESSKIAIASLKKYAFCRNKFILNYEEVFTVSNFRENTIDVFVIEKTHKNKTLETKLFSLNESPFSEKVRGIICLFFFFLNRYYGVFYMNNYLLYYICIGILLCMVISNHQVL